MTETKATYGSESAIQGEIVKRLRAAGWHVIVTSQDRRTRKQLANIPDLICFRDGTTLLIECKVPGAELRPGQVDFQCDMIPHLGTHLRYKVMRYPGDADRWCEA